MLIKDISGYTSSGRLDNVGPGLFRLCQCMSG
jgi:hypothetical protein